MIVAHIYNNSLGACYEVENVGEGITLIRKLSENELRRELTKEELEILENNYEVCDLSDADNHHTWQLGIPSKPGNENTVVTVFDE